MNKRKRVRVTTGHIKHRRVSFKSRRCSSLAHVNRDKRWCYTCLDEQSISATPTVYLCGNNGYTVPCQAHKTHCATMYMCVTVMHSLKQAKGPGQLACGLHC